MEDLEQKPITWQQLKDFVNSLPDDRLDKTAFILIDDNSQATPLSDPMLIENDIYSNVDDSEDCGSLEDLKDAHGDDFDISQYQITTNKGAPFLTTLF